MALSLNTLRAGVLPERQMPASLLFAGKVLAGSAFVALAAHIAVPLPWTPVPLTLQPMAVLLVGLLMGPVAGPAAMCAYLLEGAAGLPVFAPHGPGGVAQLLFGPSSGFLMAYPIVAALAGWLYRHLPVRSRYGAAALAGFFAMTVLYLSGAVWFAALLHTGPAATLHGAVLPFLPGECVKVLAAAGIASAPTKQASRS